MKDAGFQWNEEIPSGGISTNSYMIAMDSAAVTLTIKVLWSDLYAAIKHIIGYSQVWPTFDPNAFAGAQLPTHLERKIPARHPRWPTLIATRIVNIQGKALLRDVANQTVTVGPGTYGNYHWAYITIQFENPTFETLSDSQMTNADGTRKPEYCRFVTKTYEQNIETLARRGTDWYFVSPSVNTVTPTYPGDRLLRVAKGVVKWTWHDVAEDWLMSGKLFPANFKRCVGTVNSLAFPQTAERDRTQAGEVYARFRAGTLLLLPPKITPRTQMHPLVLANRIPASFFQRTFDVEISWVHFDPYSEDGTTIDLRDVGGIEREFVRGHNLAPLPNPVLIAGRSIGEWWTATNTDIGAVMHIQNMDQLLYQYTDHEQLFSYSNTN